MADESGEKVERSEERRSEIFQHGEGVGETGGQGCARKVIKCNFHAPIVAAFVHCCCWLAHSITAAGAAAAAGKRIYVEFRATPGACVTFENKE